MIGPGTIYFLNKKWHFKLHQMPTTYVTRPCTVHRQSTAEILKNNCPWIRLQILKFRKCLQILHMYDHFWGGTLSFLYNSKILKQQRILVSLAQKKWRVCGDFWLFSFWQWTSTLSLEFQFGSLLPKFFQHLPIYFRKIHAFLQCLLVNTISYIVQLPKM